MIVIKKLYRWLLFALIAIFAIFVIAALAIRFILFPNIDQYKDDFAAYATQRLGQKITIGDIKTGWDGISPHFSLSNIDIFDAENRPAFHLNNAEANISWLSIPMLHPHLSNLTVIEPALTIRREANGKIFLAGIDMSGPSKPEFANWLLSQREINIKNAQVIWRDDLRQAPPLSLNQLNLSLQNPAWKSLFGQHQFNITAMPSAGSKQAIVVAGRFVGRDVSKIATWHGELNIALKETDLSVWRPWLDYPVNVLAGTGDAKLKLEFADASIEKIDTHATLRDLSLMVAKQSTPFVAKQFAGDIAWSNLKNTQTISAKNIQLSTNTGLHINNGNGYYATSIKNGKPWIKTNVKLDQFDLATIKEVLPYLQLPEHIQAQLNGFSPVGSLKPLTLSIETEANKTVAYHVSTAFSGLGLSAYNALPGFSNLTGTLEATENGGEVDLQSQKALLDLKDILRWPVPADKLNGQIRWKINGNSTQISTNNLSISNPHIGGVINVNYQIKGEDYSNSVLDLNAKFDKGNAKFAPFYYPIILGKSTLHWLDTSILAGRADDVNVIVKGKLGDFPYVDSKNQPDKSLGVFKVTAKISDALLEYGEGWPLVEGINLDMLFEGKRMLLNANKGHIFGNKIIKSKTEILQLDADSPILHITSEVEGPVADGIRFVNESPVKLVTQGFTDDLKTAGNGKLFLELKIPMQDIEAAKYKGAYTVNSGTIFANAEVGLPELSQLNGTLNFTENSLSAQNISTEILGGPAQFSLRTGTDKILHVSASGNLTDTGIKKLASNMLVDSMQGSANWAGEITIKKPLVDVNLHSNLLGMAINLPAPFNKAANQEMALTVDKKQQSASNDNINISYGNLITAKLLRTAQAGNLAFERGDIGINTTAEIPNQAGLSLHGKFDYFDADDWVALLNKSSNKTDATLFNKAEFAIQKLDLFGRKLNALKFTAQPSATGLRLAIDSNEVTGDVEWQKGGNGKVIARLKNLTIPADDEAASKDAANKLAPKKEIRKLPNGYPSLDVVADNFQLGNKKLGSLTLNAFEISDAWQIQKLKISNPDSTLSADGTWYNWTRNPNTNLKFTLSVSNIGNTLKRFGQPDAIKGGDSEITGQLEWAGSPHEFDALALNGNIQLDANKGQFLKVQPGVGRLLGLLSLQSLPRRLSLDFRDLFSDGFAFDKISASANINRGILRSNDFFMTGPAAEAKIKGETNLKTETQRLKVKVIPHVSDSLSLAALAGGPIAGAAAFVAQKILKDPFNKIVQSEYIITGTWDNPQEIDPEKDNAKENTKQNTSLAPIQ